MSKLPDVYEAIVALAVDGHCKATQAEIANVAGISMRHCYEVILRLAKIKAIRIEPSSRHYGPGPRQSYRVLEKLMDSEGLPVEKLMDSEGLPVEKLMDSEGLPVEKLMDFEGLPVEKLMDSESPLVGQKGPLVRLMIHDMIHDHESMNDDMKKEIENLLDFIAGKNRAICAARCDLERAKAVRALYDYCETYNAWAEYGVREPRKGVGWLVRLIKNGSPIPPPRQLPLPAAAVDLTPPPVPTDLDLVWSQAEAALHHQMTEAAYNQILAGSRLYQENGHYVIAAQSDYGREWLEGRLLVQIKRTLGSIVGGEVEIKFKVLKPIN